MKDVKTHLQLSELGRRAIGAASGAAAGGACIVKVCEWIFLDFWHSTAVGGLLVGGLTGADAYGVLLGGKCCG